MKKWKVVIDRLSPEHEDGSRNFLDQHIICTCEKEGEARLIAARLEEPYKAITENSLPNSCQYILAVTM